VILQEDEVIKGVIDAVHVPMFGLEVKTIPPALPRGKVAIQVIPFATLLVTVLSIEPVFVQETEPLGLCISGFVIVLAPMETVPFAVYVLESSFNKIFLVPTSTPAGIEVQDKLPVVALGVYVQFTGGYVAVEIGVLPPSAEDVVAVNVPVAGNL
jgi:hypothetical protein